MTPAYFQKKYEALERAKAYNAELRERRRIRSNERSRENNRVRAKQRYIKSKLEIIREERT
jgi:hypothetical protein